MFYGLTHSTRILFLLMDVILTVNMFDLQNFIFTLIASTIFTVKKYFSMEYLLDKLKPFNHIGMYTAIDTAEQSEIEKTIELSIDSSQLEQDEDSSMLYDIFSQFISTVKDSTAPHKRDLIGKKAYQLAILKKSKKDGSVKQVLEVKNILECLYDREHTYMLVICTVNEDNQLKHKDTNVKFFIMPILTLIYLDFLMQDNGDDDPFNDKFDIQRNASMYRFVMTMNPIDGIPRVFIYKRTGVNTHEAGILRNGNQQRTPDKYGVIRDDIVVSYRYIGEYTNYNTNMTIGWSELNHDSICCNSSAYVSGFIQDMIEHENSKKVIESLANDETKNITDEISVDNSFYCPVPITYNNGFNLELLLNTFLRCHIGLSIKYINRNSRKFKIYNEHQHEHQLSDTSFGSGNGLFAEKFFVQEPEMILEDEATKVVCNNSIDTVYDKQIKFPHMSEDEWLSFCIRHTDKHPSPNVTIPQITYNRSSCVAFPAVQHESNPEVIQEIDIRGFNVQPKLEVNLDVAYVRDIQQDEIRSYVEALCEKVVTECSENPRSLKDIDKIYDMSSQEYIQTIESTLSKPDDIVEEEDKDEDEDVMKPMNEDEEDEDEEDEDGMDSMSEIPQEQPTTTEQPSSKYKQGVYVPWVIRIHQLTYSPEADPFVNEEIWRQYITRPSTIEWIKDNNFKVYNVLKIMKEYNDIVWERVDYLTLDNILNGLIRSNRIYDSCHLLYWNVVNSRAGQKLYYGFYLLDKIFSIQHEESRSKAIGLITSLTNDLKSVVERYKNKEIVNHKVVLKSEQETKACVYDLGRELKQAIHDKVIELKPLFELDDELNQELSYYIDGRQRKGYLKESSVFKNDVSKLSNHEWSIKLSELEPITHQVYYDILSKRELIDFEDSCNSIVVNHHAKTDDEAKYIRKVQKTIQTLIDIIHTRSVIDDVTFNETMKDISNWITSEL